MAKSSLRSGTTIRDYMPTTSKFSLKEARAEYSRLRKIAEKRLKRLGQSEFKTGEVYRKYKDAFQPLPKNASAERVRKMLSEVARFTERKQASISGLRESQKRQIETLQDRGYGWINKDNISTFNDYMARIMKFTAAKAYDSEEIVDLVHDFMDADLDPDDVAEDFEDYMNGVKEIPEMPEEDEDEEEALEEIRQEAPKAKQAKAAKAPKQPKQPKAKTGGKKRKK